MKRPLGPRPISAIGFGCMNLSHAYGNPPSAAEGERLLRTAIDLGVDHLDTAALYGFGANESLVAKVLKDHRSHVVLASKGGMAGVTGSDGVTRRVIDGRPEAIRANCEASLQRLGTDVIDVYYLHRVDARVPIEESVEAMAELVRDGKVRTIGLSECSAATLRRAHAVHPVAAVQSEYSLWTRNPELGVLDACREIGAAFVAFSPLARQWLTGALRDPATLAEKDLRRQMPRFAGEAWAKNLPLLDAFVAIAAERGITPAQLALAWLLARGGHVIAIPGTTREAHLRENLGALDVALDPATIGRLDALINERTVAGPRYNAATQAEIDTEEWPA